LQLLVQFSTLDDGARCALDANETTTRSFGVFSSREPVSTPLSKCGACFRSKTVSRWPKRRLRDAAEWLPEIAQAPDEGLRIMKDNPEIKGERGQAPCCLLYTFERDEAVPLMGAS
jgi:hypothetical protein